MYREQLQATRFFTINTSHELMKHAMIEDDHFHFDNINSCLPKRVNNNLNRIRTGPNYMALLWQGRWGGSGLHLVHTPTPTCLMQREHKMASQCCCFFSKHYPTVTSERWVETVNSKNHSGINTQQGQCGTLRTRLNMTAALLQCCSTAVVEPQRGSSSWLVWHPKDSIIDHLGPRWFTVNTNRGGGNSA